MLCVCVCVFGAGEVHLGVGEADPAGRQRGGGRSQPGDVERTATVQLHAGRPGSAQLVVVRRQPVPRHRGVRRQVHRRLQADAPHRRPSQPVRRLPAHGRTVRYRVRRAVVNRNRPHRHHS